MSPRPHALASDINKHGARSAHDRLVDASIDCNLCRTEGSCKPDGPKRCTPRPAVATGGYRPIVPRSNEQRRLASHRASHGQRFSDQTQSSSGRCSTSSRSMGMTARSVEGFDRRNVVDRTGVVRACRRGAIRPIAECLRSAMCSTGRRKSVMRSCRTAFDRSHFVPLLLPESVWSV